MDQLKGRYRGGGEGGQQWKNMNDEPNIKSHLLQEKWNWDVPRDSSNDQEQ